MDTDHQKVVARAKEIIEGSRLPEKDKVLLLGRVPFAPAMVVAMFVQICDEDPFSIEMLVKNLKMKLDAAGNLAKIHEIVKHEREEFLHAVGAT